MRLTTGLLEAVRTGEDEWCLYWTPDVGEADSAVSYSQLDALPPGYPGPKDPVALLAWGQTLHGHKRR